MTKNVFIKSLLTAGVLLAAHVGFSVAFAALPAPWPITAVTGQPETEVLKGTKFITVVNSNTMLGKTKTGTEFLAYFISGGIVGYEDKTGKKDTGTWRMREDGAVCITWIGPLAGEERCAIVKMKGRILKFEGNTRFGQVKLLGGRRHWSLDS